MGRRDLEHLTNWNDPKYALLKNLLRFSKNIEIEIDYYTAKTAIYVMKAINKFAPEKKIHIRCGSDNV